MNAAPLRLCNHRPCQTVQPDRREAQACQQQQRPGPKERFRIGRLASRERRDDERNGHHSGDRPSHSPPIPSRFPPLINTSL